MHHCMGLGTLSKTIFCQYSCLCHPQMSVKALTCICTSIWQELAICKRHPETPSSSVGQSLFSVDWGKMEKLFHGQMNQNLSLFETTYYMPSLIKRKETDQKPCLSDGIGVHGQLAHLKMQPSMQNNLCFHPYNVFFMEVLADFSKTT